MLNIDLSHRVVVVSGGSQGVGQGIVEMLAKAQAKIVIVHYDKDECKVNETLDLIAPYEVETLVIRANVTNPDEVKALYEQTVSKFGQIDILVNNAGIGILGTMLDLSYEQINAVVNVNLMGPITMAKEVLPYMIKQKFGRIINIASTSMYTGGGGGPHYAASKSGLMGFMRNLSKEYGKYNITTNNLAISLIDTVMFRNRYPEESDREQVIQGVPVKRAGKPADIGYAVCFLASDMAGYINGEIINIDGGRLYA